VVATLIGALIEGLRTGGLKDGQLLQFDNQDNALSFLMAKENRREGDVVLIENDLPMFMRLWRDSKFYRN